MADAQANIQVGVDTSQALANLKALQSQISAFQTSMAKGSATQAANAAKIRQNLMNDINATNKFAASITNIKTTTESFTESLEKNKLSMGQYFKYAGGASKSFGKLFQSEMSTIEKVARERVKTLQTQYIQLGRDANGAMRAIAVRPLMLDMDNLATKTAIAAQKQQILNQLLKQGSTNLLNFGKNTQWAGRQLMVGFTVPLTMAGTAAAKTYMEMEKAIVKFKRVYGDLNTTGAETAKTLSQLQQLANEFTKYGVAVSDTMDMAAQAAATGKMGADLIAQVNQATKLAVLGGVEQSQALETTISLTNAFGTAADQLSGKIDFLNAVENQTVTSIEDLTIAIPKAAPVIQQLGGDVEDLAFFLTAMKEGGINASEGANALKSGLASMINPTKKASEFLAGFGINVKGIVEGTKGNVKETIVQMAKAFDTLDPLNRARAIEQMFGKFQFARISTLFQNVIKEGSQAQTVLGLTQNTAEELAVLSQRELNKISDSPMYKFEKTLEDIKTKIVPIGEAFLKMITPIIEWAGTLIDNFNKMGDGVKNFWMTLVAGVAGLGPVLLMGFGLVANGVANLIKMFAGLKSWFNRTSDSSNILGQATSYMTQEQLEAASVAASLDQSHSKLIQTFTSEAASVDLLRNAYEKATIAQQQFSTANVIPTAVVSAPKPSVSPKPTTGYANGVLMVPGPKGAGDIVPAMLAPGEAVIPADKAKKYGGLINGIIAGNIPGFAAGRRSPSDIMAEEAISPQVVQQIKDVSLKIGQTPKAIEQVFNWLLQELDVVHKRTDNKSQTILGNTEAQIQQKMFEWVNGLVDSKIQVASKSELKSLYAAPEGRAVHEMYSGQVGMGERQQFGHLDGGISLPAREIADTLKITSEKVLGNVRKVLELFPDAKADALSGFGVGMLGKINNRMKSSGVSVDEFSQDYGSRSLEQKWGDMLKITGTDIESVRSQLLSYDQEIAKIVQERKAKGASIIVDSQAQVDQARAKAAKAGQDFNEADYVILEEVAKQAQENIRDFGGDINAVIDKARNTVTEIRIQLTKQQEALYKEVYGTTYAQSQGGGTKEFRIEGGMGEGLETPQAKAKAKEFRDSQNQKNFNDQAQKTADTHSESKRTKQIAKDTVDGFINEIDRSKDKISGVAKKLVDNLQAGFDSRLQQIGGGMVPVPDGTEMDRLTKKSKRIISDAVKDQGNIFAGVAGKVVVLNDGLTAVANSAANAANAATQEAVATDNATASEKENTNATENNTNATRNNTVSKDADTQSKSGWKDFFTDTNGKNADGSRKSGFMGRIGGTSGIKKGFGAASMAVGMASMVPGVVGQTAQAIMGPISAATAAMSMIPGPAGLVAGGLALVAVTTMAVVDMLNKNRKKAAELQENLSSSNKAMAKFAEFAKKVTASEIMSKRRESQLGVFNYAPGKKSFGTSFMESDAGKQLLAAVGEETSFGRGTGSAQALVTNQLLAAVTSGALTSAQARSISAALGTALGDQTFAMKVTGDLLSLTGPDGEELTKDPLKLRLDVITKGAEALDTLKTDMETATALGTNGWDYLLDIGTLGISAGIRYQDNLGKAAGRWQVQAQALIESGQQQIDSLDLEYEKRINNLYAAGKIAEAEALTNKHLEDRKVLMDANSVNFQNMIDSVNQANNDWGFFGGGMQNAMSNQANDSITKAYEGTAFAATAENIRNQIDSAGGSKGQQVALKSLVGGKQLGLDQAGLAVKLFGGSQQGMDQLSGLFKSGDFGMANTALSLASLFKDQTVAKQFIIDVQSKGPLDQKAFVDAMALVQKSGVVSDINMIVTYFQKNPAKALEIKKQIDEIKRQPEITQDIIVQYLGQETMDAVKTDYDYFNSLNKENKITYLTTVETELAMQTNPEWQADKALYEKEHGGKKISNVAYAAILGNLETQGTKDVVAPGDITGGGGTGGSGPSASWLDEIVKKTRDLFNANEQLTVGYKASGDALAAFYKKGKVALTGMAGLQTKLAGAGLGRDIISNILGMPKEEADKWMKMFFKGGSVTEFAKNVNAIMYANKAGDYIAETQLLTNDYKEQGKALKILTAAGTDQAAMQAMLNDENVRSIVYGATLTGKISDQIAKTKELTKAYIGQLALERLRKDPRQATIDSANIKIETIQKQNAVWQNGLEIISKQEEKISAVYDKQIAALNEVKSINDQISRQKQGELDLADALSRGDIGAAAKAAESIRAQRAQDAVDNQVKALEDAKKRAIDSISVEIGGKKYTKLELTNKIADAELSVLEIQKDQVVQQELSIAKDKERLDALAKIKAAELAVIAAKNSGLKNNKAGTGKSGASGLGGNDGKGGLDPKSPVGPTPTPTPTTTPTPVTPGAATSTLMKAPLGSSTAASMFDRFGENDFWQGKLDAAHADVKTKQGALDTFKKKLGVDSFDMDKGKSFYLKKFAATDTAGRKGFESAWDNLVTAKATEKSFDNGMANQGKRRNSPGAQAFMDQYGKNLPTWLKNNLDILKNKSKQYATDHDAIAATRKPLSAMLNKYSFAANTTKAQFAASSATKEDKALFAGLYDAYKNAISTRDANKKLVADTRKYLETQGINEDNTAWYLGLGAFGQTEVRQPGYYNEKGYATGGHITGRGTGTSDSIPAMLSNGEFVIKASAVDKIGVGVLNRLNQTGDISRFALGGLSTAAFKTPIMAKGGEFVMSNYSIKQFSTDAANAINSGSATSIGDSVYNYSVNVNVSNAGANANDIARTVINQIRQIDSQRIRSNNF